MARTARPHVQPLRHRLADQLEHTFNPVHWSQATRIEPEFGAGLERAHESSGFNLIDLRLCGGVAQLGERRVRNAKVGSSILLLSTIHTSQDVPQSPWMS